MHPNSPNFYEIENFKLNCSEKLLLRDGSPIPLTPKVFDTLEILVENAGKLVEKDELIRRIWQDHFVEVGNLTSNIKMLRKAFGDDAQHPRFIETVQRRGYRFIADVRQSYNENGSAQTAPASTQRKAVISLRSRKLFIASIAVLIMGVIVGGLWYARSRDINSEAPILLADFGAENLSADGRVRIAAISQDSKYVVYTNGAGGTESVWLRDLESSSNRQIIPPTKNLYFGLVISPDSRTLYFARLQQNPNEGQQADIYRMPIFGGVPVKIINQAQGSIGLSADGTKISFRRCPYTEDEYCSLWISDSDGKNEKRLLARPHPIRIGGNQISPDGRTIAFAAGESSNWANEFGLAEIDIESGVEREVTKEKFFDIKQVSWLPNQQGLLLIAKKFPDNNFRIWHVTTPAGEIKALTNNSDDYASFSLNAEVSALVAIKNSADFRLNTYRMNGSAAELGIAAASSVNFAPSGKIVFSSEMTGNHEIWTINADGTERRQLTNYAGVDLDGVISHDSNFVFFESNRTGEAQVWRMNADGSDQIQITHHEGGYPKLISTDQKWLYYISARQKNLMRVSSEGGTEEVVLDKRNPHFALSSDASYVAFAESRNKQTLIFVVSIPDKQTIKTFNVPNTRAGVFQGAWAPDGKSIFYVWPDDRSERFILWQQPLDGSTPSRIADLGPDELRETEAFALSPDGKTFAAIQGRWKHDAVLIRGLK